MNPLFKAIASVHKAVYQISNGRIGSKMGGNDILILEHVGAKSGKKYASPLAYVQDGDAYAIIASAAGQANNPGWYHNLKKNPNTTINIAGESIDVRAEVAPREKRDQLWAKVAADFPQFEDYQSKTSRVIPIILLHPQSP